MRDYKKIWGIWLLALLLVVAAGCGTTNNANDVGKESTTQEQNSNNGTVNEEGANRTTYPLIVQDSSGAEFTFESAPQRIVSLAPSETEGLFALGLDEQVVGVSDNDDYPEAVKDKPKMGGFQVNVEAVVAAQPDLVMAANLIDPATVKSLTDLGIKVYQSNPKTVNDVIEHIRTLGEITDHQAEAEKVAKQMEDELNQVTEAVKGLTDDQKKQVYIEFSPGWTVGKGEFMDELIMLAGGVNVASDITGWSEINEENIIQSNPDVILYSLSVIDENNQTLSDIIKGRGGWKEITAIKEDHVIGLEDNLVSRPGPRVTQGLIAVATAIYPELMQQ